MDREKIMHLSVKPTRKIGDVRQLVLFLLLTAWGAHSSLGEETPAIAADTLRHKVLCGYQGWFRCAGDGTDEGWLHWSRNRNKITPDSLTVEMWPDMSEYSESERYPVPSFTGPKVSNTPPTQARFQTFEGLPSDWYLQLTSEGTKVIRGEREVAAALPLELRSTSKSE